MPTKITYNNNDLISFESGTKTLKTKNKYCQGNFTISSSRLPYEYQEVEYLQSSGTQWIDSGITVNKINRVLAKLNITSFRSNDMHFFSGRQYSGQGYKQYISWNNQQKFQTGLSTSSTSSNNVTHSENIASTNTDYIINSLNISGYQVLTVNGNVWISTTKVCSDDIVFTGRLFVWNGAGSSGSDDSFVGKCYYCKLYNNDQLLHDFVPCYRKSDSVPGMYDLINGQFFTNSGSGTFTVGPDVD